MCERMCMVEWVGESGLEGRGGGVWVGRGGGGGGGGGCVDMNGA